MKEGQRSSHLPTHSETGQFKRSLSEPVEMALVAVPSVELYKVPFAAARIGGKSLEEIEYLRKQDERGHSIENEEARRARWGGLVGFTEDMARVIGKIDRSINSFVFKLAATWLVADLAFLGGTNYVFSTIFGVSLWVWPLGVGWIALVILGALIFAAALPGGRGWY